MRRNYNLELRLLPYSDSLSSEDFSLAAGYGHNLTMGESSVSPQNQQQQLTIFYNGQVCICDVTEFQAKAILLLASREMEPASPANPESQLYSPNSGLSMKRSLQRFLQKRKHRSLATSPY
ncbi:protein TIFY 5A [Citrus sinensis]|uniref:protein TIFY 5A n=1 Tax=Citrus sinensis TaxID=2711 RepID=UPI0003D789EE|nr:protein TIFY 5A [Citrus sinensis]KAH9749467.1 protein TIFY 5A [Citrus sinensis]